MRIPLATYRLQFNAHFCFKDAASIIAYLNALGISDIYASPVLRACPGSLHGYDVIDHSCLNPELGSEQDFREFAQALKPLNMGLLLDVVPNHMGIGDPSNYWWQDVLENGPSAVFAKFFDIDWNPPKQDLVNRVLLPFLGDPYGKVLERGELQLTYNKGAFFIHYFARRFPVAPRTWAFILDPVLKKSRMTGAKAEHLAQLAAILEGVKQLPERTEKDPKRIQERYKSKEVIKRQLNQLVLESSMIRAALEKSVAELNGQPEQPQSFDGIDKLLAEQAYRLAYWRVACDEINYRRFFDVNELAAIRVEDQQVFEAVHRLLFRLGHEGHVTGLRIDHPDGLWDPEAYFRSIQQHCSGDKQAPFYVVVEKILCSGERLRDYWKVQGTTGYEFLNYLNGLFIDGDEAAAIRKLYTRFTGMPVSFDDLVYACKKLILNVSLSSELYVLARKLDRISEQRRWSQDFTLMSLHGALQEVVACFPVYRTYIRGSRENISPQGRQSVMAAVNAARRRNPSIDASIFDFISSVLLLDYPPDLTEAEKNQRREFVMKLQQVTGPIMAKAVEDTAFYRVYPLASINEVGGDAGQFGIAPKIFHEAMAHRFAKWPYALSATSTHDTKRSEDVRARLNVLSEVPKQWAAAIARWRMLNRNKKTSLYDAPIPDANEEYLLYQTLLGVWPLDVLDPEKQKAVSERIEAYMIKALREAKFHTSWISPDENYEEKVTQFIRQILKPVAPNRFLAEFQQFLATIVGAGAVNALSQVLLKITAPGVPDFYQGTELWNFSLVDPDNRRPIDYENQQSILQSLKHAAQKDLPRLIQDLLVHWRDGRIKMYLTYKALAFRQQEQTLFLKGDYIPLNVSGSRAKHLFAFARRLGNAWALVVVPRFLANLGYRTADILLPPDGVWADTRVLLPDGCTAAWRNVLTQERIVVTDGHLLHPEALFKRFPIALLSQVTHAAGDTGGPLLQ